MDTSTCPGSPGRRPASPDGGQSTTTEPRLVVDRSLDVPIYRVFLDGTQVGIVWRDRSVRRGQYGEWRARPGANATVNHLDHASQPCDSRAVAVRVVLASASAQT